MTEIETITDCDDEDVSDVVPIIEKSFGIRFREEAFKHVQTVGDLLAVVQTYVNYPHHESCTSQSAFYRVRNSIARIQSIEPQNIRPDSSLEELFPAADRRKKIIALKCSLGVKTDFLAPPDWVSISIFFGLIISLIALFFSGVAGLCGIVFFKISLVVAKRLGKNFTVHSIRALVEKISNENYMAMRRQAGTVNRNEIWNTVVNILSTTLFIDKKYITAESRFIWADPVPE